MGNEIYRRNTQRQLEARHVGDVVAIDVDSGDYALDANAIAASESLRNHHPGTRVWLMRVGHSTLYRFRGSSQRRARPDRNTCIECIAGID